MKNQIKLLGYPIAIIFLFAIVASLVYNWPTTIYFAVVSLILFLIELLKGRRNPEALCFIIVVLIMIIIYKALT
jgi:hypothetical protein